MKLSEILTEATIFDENVLKNTAWKNPKELAVWLKQNGFKRLGQGAFASAYAKSGSNRIVKISTAEDNCWISFATWALKQTKNPYLPNIPWFKTYQSKGKKGQILTFFVTIVEKLKPFNESIVDKIDDPVVLATLYVHTDAGAEYRTSIGRRLNQLGVLDKRDLIPGKLSHRIDKATQYLKNHTNHKFLKTIMQVEKMTTKNCWNDMHTGNFMYRPATNTLVITDPLAGFYES